MPDLLPPLPMDDGSLDLYWSAVRPGPDGDRSSLRDVLSFLSEMAGSDVTAVVEDESDDVFTVMRDPKYHPNDLIAALVTEIRRLRGSDA